MQRGFIAELPGGVLKNAKGDVVYDVKKLQVTANAPAPDTMNPSLWRISQLNSFAGLFKVIDRLYQVRTIDIANLHPLGRIARLRPAERVGRHIEGYRDAFKYIHDRSLHLANAGYTMPEIGELVQYPPELARSWATRGYYGTVSHNARAVYNFYLGYFGEHPAELEPLPPVQAAPRYVAPMGGADAILEHAQKAYDSGDYRWAAQLLQHLIFAQPDNQAARFLQADAFEQLGYQTEAATWRNIYFTGARELRVGTPSHDPSVASPVDLLRNLPLEMAFDYLGIQLDDAKTAGKVLATNVEVEGTSQTYALVLENRVLNSFATPVASPDLTIKGTREAIVLALMSGKPDQAIAQGTIKADGRAAALTELFNLTTPPQFWFPIITRPMWRA